MRFLVPALATIPCLYLWWSALFLQPSEAPQQASQKSYAEEVYELQAKLGIGHADVIHKPRSGCPPGYTLVPEFFSKGKETFDACRRREPRSSRTPGGVMVDTGTIDFVLPQEGFGIPLAFPMPESPPSGKKI
jgi:hypothetical protein